MSIKAIYSAISLMNVKMIETISVLHVEITLILVFSLVFWEWLEDLITMRGKMWTLILTG